MRATNAPLPIGYAIYTIISLFLALWASHAAAQAPAMPLDEVRQGTLLMQTGTPGRYAPAPLQETDASIVVTGPIARATVRQRFRNPGDTWAEAVYAFPLPEDAAVDHMALQVGERIIQGVIQEKTKARETYRRAKQAGQRAGLVEQHRPNLFTTAVANIPPRGEILVVIEYQQPLRWRDGEFGLRFPMAITPRFVPGSAGTLDESLAGVSGWAILPGEVPNSVDIAAPAGAEPGPALNPVTLEIQLDAGFPLDQVTSRYHPVDIEHADRGRVTVRLADGSVPAERDFELAWTPQLGQAPRAAFFTEHTQKGDYGLLMVMPPSSAFAEASRAAREIVFVIDTSGSMGGASIRQARDALGMALGRLRPDDRFNVIEFDSDTHALHPAPVPASPEHLERALRWVANLEAGGGTRMYPALQRAFETHADAGGRLRQVIFITDGAVGNEQQLLELIGRELGNRRLFTVGIGSAPNSHFMTEAAHAGRGTFTYIGNVNEVREKMNLLFSKVEHPALTDLRLDLPVVAELVPDPLPDLYAGEPVTVIMKLDGIPDQALIEGNIGGLRWKNNLSLRAGSGQTGLGVYWARERIRHWMRARSRGVDAASVRQAVLDLALRHHLVSQYTSLVAVDATPVRPAGEGLQSHALKGNLPAGWQPTAVATSQTGAIHLAMAAGATSFQAWLVTGLVLLLVAGLVLRRGGYAGTAG